MKIRIISALVALFLVVPLIIFGGTLYNIAVFIVAMISLSEFINIKSSGKKVPVFLRGVSYVMLAIILVAQDFNKSQLLMDYRILSGLFLVYLLPTVLYHDNKKYSINDAFYLMGGIFFLGISFQLLMVIRHLNFNILAYLFIITITSDTFAYFTGYFIGRNKLLESISPKKTWEGLIGGTIMGVIISVMFYINIINPNINLLLLITATIFLSVLGQLGDLVFSSIKRYFGKKDFSDIMPGHGGILDRMDSIIFVIISYMFFMTFL